jgi:hypothetical protein
MSLGKRVLKANPNIIIREEWTGKKRREISSGDLNE